MTKKIKKSEDEIMDNKEMKMNAKIEITLDNQKNNEIYWQLVHILNRICLDNEGVNYSTKEINYYE